ncbi:biotin--[acetyl-CoA-carboxylase] ligase [Candidatus Bathyarchaeota archaeon]|nr:MAG: biotin--[acetyl-CoA-carboxylase] ligase [Candidatus Bathyarchaeota archaeon]
MKIIRYKRISSTNNKAKTLAEKRAAEWTVVVAEVQTHGRGRSGRSWKSPKGGLWFSVVIRPRTPINRIQLLQFWVANALRKGIEEVYDVQSELKWPNDIVVDWKKLAGLLIETKISGPALLYAIVGIGLNVNLTAEQLPTGATSIFLARKKRFSLEKTCSSILTVLERHYETLRDESAVVGEWWMHCAHRMKPVIIETGNDKIRGKCVGVNPDGSIIIQTDRGNLTIPDGTLQLDE